MSDKLKAEVADLDVGMKKLKEEREQHKAAIENIDRDYENMKRERDAISRFLREEGLT